MANLKIGSKGKPVEAMQDLLNKVKSKPKLKIDGIFGPLTQKALVAFQSKYKKYMKTDAVYGDKTAYAIDAVLKGPKVKLNIPKGSLNELAEKYDTLASEAKSRNAFCKYPVENAAFLKMIARDIEETSKVLTALFDEMDAKMKVLDKASLTQLNISEEFSKGGFVSKSWTEDKNKALAKLAAVGTAAAPEKLQKRLRELVKVHNTALSSIPKNTGII